MRGRARWLFLGGGRGKQRWVREKGEGGIQDKTSTPTNRHARGDLNRQRYSSIFHTRARDGQGEGVAQRNRGNLQGGEKKRRSQCKGKRSRKNSAYRSKKTEEREGHQSDIDAITEKKEESAEERETGKAAIDKSGKILSRVGGKKNGKRRRKPLTGFGLRGVYMVLRGGLWRRRPQKS